MVSISTSRTWDRQTEKEIPSLNSYAAIEVRRRGRIGRYDTLSLIGGWTCWVRTAYKRQRGHVRWQPSIQINSVKKHDWKQLLHDSVRIDSNGYRIQISPGLNYNTHRTIAPPECILMPGSERCYIAAEKDEILDKTPGVTFYIEEQEYRVNQIEIIESTCTLSYTDNAHLR